MKDFVDTKMESLLHKHNLNSFEALWSLELQAVDEPNKQGGGHSTVFYLELDGQGFYLNRQVNYFTRTLRKPLGKPTFAREFRMIDRFKDINIPALQAAYFAQRRVAGRSKAILITYALQGWCDLEHYLKLWSELPSRQKEAIIQACAKLTETLHKAGKVHRCLYPKHIFLHETAEGYNAKLIDLEKARRILLGKHDRIRDIETLLRRANHAWGESEQRLFLQYCLGNKTQVDAWYRLVEKRHQKKVSR